MVERMRRAGQRTHRRLASVLAAAAPVRWGDTEYIADYSIGDPPQPAQAVVDTGSDLVWTQCMSCGSYYCFPQTLPRFNFSRSRTAYSVRCNGTLCTDAHEISGQCLGDTGVCAIIARYGAGDVGGFLGIEEFTFGSEKVTVAFGAMIASHLQPGSLNGASGLIGLGRGELSLVSQVSGGMFSYCLTPYFSDHVDTSHLFVGSSASMSGGYNTRGVITTVPFVANPKEDPYNTFYYLPLVGMTVGDARLIIPASAFDLRQVEPGLWAGGVIVDSGSPLTGLVDVAYEALSQELKRQLDGSLVTSPIDMLELCVTRGDVGKLVPPLVLHFSGGGDLALPAKNYWAPVDEGTACMVVFSTARVNLTMPMNETTVIGNYMQQDVHVLYDLGNGEISFQPAYCNSI
ncbi:unnamed protein product [Alopecurus aequalis]